MFLGVGGRAGDGYKSALPKRPLMEKELMDLGLSCCFPMICMSGVGRMRAALMEAGCH